ncbi:MAG: serine/threonine-protein kinase [Candidatus Eremiobacterota bacterium]
MPATYKKSLKNRYKIITQLGYGGMGTVYKAKDEILNIDVAVKELFNHTKEAVEQFEKEAKILAGLNHASLPRVTDFFEEDGKKYLVMDYIEGYDLEKILENTSEFLPEQRVKEWIIELLDILQYIHSKGIIHRDIKPANLKQNPSGKIILVDFGIAKAGFNSMTNMGATGFTPYMAPPEQCTGSGRTGVYSDIYSAGATMYYLLTGTVPAESVMRMMGIELIKPSQINRSIHQETEKIILKSMSLEINCRYSSAKEMKDALSVVSESSISISTYVFRRDIRKF